MSGALRSIVIGVGNPDRGDDAAGRLVARLLRGTVPEHVTVCEHPGEGTGLLDLLQGYDEAVFVDACVSRAAPGRLEVFDANSEVLPDGLCGASSHGFGLAEAIGLGRALGSLPCRCRLYAITGECFAAGAQPSAPVAAAVTDTARRILADLDASVSEPRRR